MTNIQTSKIKLMVFGYKRHGKDTACEYLKDKYGVTFESSSRRACDLFLFEKLKDEFGYKTADEAFEDRVNHRARWYEEIKSFCEINGLTALGDNIYQDSDCYCGIRDDKEFYALKDKSAFQLSVWIDACERLEPEDSSSNKLTKDDADLVIDNNGAIEDLYPLLDELYHKYLKP